MGISQIQRKLRNNDKRVENVKYLIKFFIINHSEGVVIQNSFIST
jgi:hypothetical protein